MGYCDTFASFAEQEEGTNWHQNQGRILEYFEASTGMQFTKADALRISWCTYFVMWGLQQASVDPSPQVGSVPPRNFATGRFIASVDGKTSGNVGGDHNYWGVYPAHSVALRKYTPSRGDLYYLPNYNNHIGIITDTMSDGRIVTINGNSGPSKAEGTDWRLDPSGQIGDGFVCRKVHNLMSSKDMYKYALWIEVPDY